MVQQQVVIHAAAPGTEVLWRVTYLPVQKYRYIPAFLGASDAVSKQVECSEGAVRYGLKANPITKKFWAASVWKDHTAMRAYVRAEPHLSTMKRFEEWAGEGAAFVEWKAPDGPIDWRDVERRMKTPTFYYKKPSGT
ncbi:MAG: DUF3291 domain-containing protein [Dehalococcoidia bacterium]|nr:DUF3291 domain-containing protein [Dehalococcoidia bacterium]